MVGTSRLHRPAELHRLPQPKPGHLQASNTEWMLLAGGQCQGREPGMVKADKTAVLESLGSLWGASSGLDRQRAEGTALWG